MMKKLTRSILMAGGLLWPMLAYAGEREDKYAFLITGGIGGVAIGLGMYAFFMVLSAALYRDKKVVTGLFALCTIVFSYIEFWSFRLLTFSVGFLQNSQPNQAPPAWPAILKWALALVVVLGLFIFSIALRMWHKWHSGNERPDLYR